MSVVVGILNKQISVIGSDTMIYSSYNLSEGRYAVAQNPYPKIFSHNNIIGGVTGMMDLGGKGIIENIVEILDSASFIHIDVVRNQLIQGIYKKMLVEPVTHKSKVLELLFISKNDNYFEFYSINFMPVANNRIYIVQTNYGSTRDLKDNYNFIYITLGSGWKDAFDYLKKQTPTEGIGLLIPDYYSKITEESINEAIKKCGTHPGANPEIFSPSCGGTPEIMKLSWDLH